MTEKEVAEKIVKIIRKIEFPVNPEDDKGSALIRMHINFGMSLARSVILQKIDDFIKEI